jgi:hypothetical protein
MRCTGSACRLRAVFARSRRAVFNPALRGQTTRRVASEERILIEPRAQSASRPDDRALLEHVAQSDTGARSSAGAVGKELMWLPALALLGGIVWLQRRRSAETVPASAPATAGED